jgi:hypothetical protein
MTTSLLLWALLVPALIALGVVLWLTETREQRIRRWHRQGMSQLAIAARMGITRHRVRKALTA